MPPSPFECRLDFLSADPYGNPIYGSDGNLNMEFVMILRLKEDTASAGSYDPYTCKVRDYFFYECLDIASPQTLSSSINGSFGVSASSTAFTWLSDGLNTSIACRQRSQSPLVCAHGPFRERQPGAGGGLLSDLGRGDRDRRERWLLRLCQLRQLAVGWWRSLCGNHLALRAW